MNLKLWIDTEPPPDDTWDWVNTSDAAIETIRWFKDDYMQMFALEEISLCWKLRGDDTSEPVLKWMKINRIRFEKYNAHEATTEQRLTALQYFKEL